MLLSKQLLYRNRCTLTSGIRSLVSSLSLEAIEKAAARHAANHFISSMDKKSNYIDTPTICVSDPSSLTSWEWSASLDSKTKLTPEEILQMSKNCTVDAFQLVEKDISTLSGMLALLLFVYNRINERYPLRNRGMIPSMIIVVYTDNFFFIFMTPFPRTWWQLVSPMYQQQFTPRICSPYDLSLYQAVLKSYLVATTQCSKDVPSTSSR